jgi:tellurite resistance protein TerA
MKQVEKGQRLPLLSEDVADTFLVGVFWDQSSVQGYDIDASVMLLSERGKLEEEGNFVFYNNSRSICGGVTMSGSPVGHYRKVFSVDLRKLSSGISRLMFIMTIDNGDALNQRFGSVKNISVDILNDRTQNAMLQFKVEGLSTETAVITMEIYRKNNEWRLQANGSGFNAGLAAILKNYGSEKVQVEDHHAPAPPPTPPPAPPRQQPPPTPPPAPPPPKQEPRVSLSKITLEKKGDKASIDLTKRGVGDNNELHINLNWNHQSQKKGFWGSTGGEALDLDLGCMFEMLDGSRGVIQALGRSFGSRHGFPFIYLDKDDRTGASSEGENLCIYRPDLLRRAAVFAFIYEGKSDFQNAGAVLVLKGLNNEITVRLDSPRPYLQFCVGLYIENRNGEIVIKKINEYVMDHRECDAMFGFNFRWSAGSKD